MALFPVVSFHIFEETCILLDAPFQVELNGLFSSVIIIRMHVKLMYCFSSYQALKLESYFQYSIDISKEQSFRYCMWNSLMQKSGFAKMCYYIRFAQIGSHAETRTCTCTRAHSPTHTCALTHAHTHVCMHVQIILTRLTLLLD